MAELRTGSEEFARLRACHAVSAPASLRKTLLHPLVGPMTVYYDILDIPDRDQRVVIYTADPVSSAGEALRPLSVIGAQKMDVAQLSHLRGTLTRENLCQTNGSAARVSRSSKLPRHNPDAVSDERLIKDAVVLDIGTDSSLLLGWKSESARTGSLNVHGARS